MGFVYQVTNDINGKIYVGKTEEYPPEKRWKQHLKEAKRERAKDRPFYRAINKYGEEHFHFQVIEETEETSEREAYWIDKLRTYVGFPDCNGYNATMGGDGKKYINLDEEEIIQYHLNEAQMIVRYTANHFKADRKTIKNILIKHNIKWLSGTEIKQKVAMEKHGYIYMVDQDKTRIIKKYPSCNLASIETGFNDNSITNAVKGKDRKDKSKIHFYKGYYWYSDESIPEELLKNQ